MRKILLLVAAIAITGFAGLLPFRGTDVAKLHPVEVLVVYEAGEMVNIETDTGLLGIGESVGKTIENLKLVAAGEIFLDTANYVLIGENSILLLNELYDFLRPACQVYIFSGRGEWTNVAEYLETHPSIITLLSYRQGKGEIPKIVVKGEDYRIATS